MTFWVLLALITLIIGSIAFFPLLKNAPKISHSKRDKLNKAFYFDRLQEVEREANEGVIDDPEQTKLELQQNLLDDIPDQNEALPTPHQSASKLWFIGLILAIGTMSTAVYWNVGSWFSVTANYQPLDYFYERLKHEDTDPLSAEEISQFTMALQAEIKDHPDDAKSWFLLGQIGMATDNLQMALDSYAKATAIVPDDLLYKQKYAEVLMLSADTEDKTKGEALIKEIIRVDHTNIGALRLLAFHLFEQEDYKMAAMTWGMILKLLPKDDPSRATIERSIQSALSLMKTQKNSSQIQ